MIRLRPCVARLPALGQEEIGFRAAAEQIRGGDGLIFGSQRTRD